VHALDPEGVRMFDTLEKPLVVTGSARELGLVRIAHRWRVPKPVQPAGAAAHSRRETPGKIPADL
jgi:lipopolysaccharide transport system ATP-binding protein